MATPFPNWFDVRDYASIQAAINAATGPTTGGTVYIPSGVYTLPNTPGNTLLIPANQGNDKRLRLLGDGPGQTIIRQTRSEDIIQVLGDETVIEGISFQGPASLTPLPTAGRGMVIGSPTQTATITRVYLIRSEVLYTFTYCLHVVERVDGGFTSIFCSYLDCRFGSNLHDAAVLIEKRNTTHFFKGCHIQGFSDHGLKLLGCEGISFIDGAIEGPGGATFQPYCYARNVTNVLLQHIWFEDTPTTPVQWYVYLEDLCHNVTIDTCTFRRLNGLDPKAIVVGNTELGPCKAVAIINPQIVVSTVGTMTTNNHIAIGNAETEAYLIGGYLEQKTTPTPTLLPIRVSDGSNKSMLFGGNRRVRLPRLTTTEILALQDPKVGQMVYNMTTNRVDIYNGAWVGVATGIM